MNYSIKTMILSSAAAILLTACGSESSFNNDNDTTVTGYLHDAPIANMGYVCGNNSVMKYTDNNGTFECNEGDLPVIFKVGDFEVGRIADVTNGAIIYPQDLVGESHDTINEDVIKLAAFLQSLDDDGDISERITIRSNFSVGTTKKFEELTQEEIEQLLKDAGITPVSLADAEEHLRANLNLPKETDTTKPIITLVGNANVTITVGGSYSDAGATANDNVDGDITGEIVTVNPVNTAKVGTYTVTYNVSDSAGNAASQVSRTVHVVAASDTTKPIISLTGAAEVDVNIGTVYKDAGATANDNVDGDISAEIVTVNPVDSSKLGTYTVTYNVSDSSGNAASQISRTVRVVDTVAPVITLGGNASINVTVGNAYNDAGATANDNVDGDISGNIVTVNPVNTVTVGTYTVTYNVSDSSGNAANQVSRTVHVVAAPDTTKPTISLTGDTEVTVSIDSAYNDAGATANDNVDGDISGNIVTVNPVDTSVPGTYYVTYNVEDTAGNSADEITRTVNVEDDVVPTITLTGETEVTVNVGSVYNDAGATANDNVDGDITGDIATVNGVDTSVPGTYTVKYNVEDTAGNMAAEVVRTVNVVDNEIPIITLVGEAEVNVTEGSEYSDAGATAEDAVDGELTRNIVVNSDVNTAVVGTYHVTYDVNDSAGNSAVQVVRTVNVVAAPLTLTLKKTGQTTSYFNYDDGFYQKGVDINYTRDNSNGVVTDNVTGLMWQDNAAAASQTGTWSEADNYCSALDLPLGIYSDWRLPTIDELTFIVDRRKSTKTIHSSFQNVTTTHYWTSTVDAANSSNKWVIRFDTARDGTLDITNTRNVRCVRDIN